MEIVNVGIIKDIEVPIPPKALQKKFLEIHRRLMMQKTLTQESIIKSEELFQSLLQRAFGGSWCGSEIHNHQEIKSSFKCVFLPI